MAIYAKADITNIDNQSKPNNHNNILMPVKNYRSRVNHAVFILSYTGKFLKNVPKKDRKDAFSSFR